LFTKNKMLKLLEQEIKAAGFDISPLAEAIKKGDVISVYFHIEKTKEYIQKQPISEEIKLEKMWYLDRMFLTFIGQADDIKPVTPIKSVSLLIKKLENIEQRTRKYIRGMPIFIAAKDGVDYNTKYVYNEIMNSEEYKQIQQLMRKYKENRSSYRKKQIDSLKQKLKERLRKKEY